MYTGCTDSAAEQELPSAGGVVVSHNQVEAGVEAETAPGGITKPSVSAAVSIKQVFKCTTPPAVLKESIPLSLRALNRDVKIQY